MPAMAAMAQAGRQKAMRLALLYPGLFTGVHPCGEEQRAGQRQREHEDGRPHAHGPSSNLTFVASGLLLRRLIASANSTL